MGKLFDELCSVVGYAGDGGVGKMINAVAQSIAFDFLMDGERAALIVVMKLHLRGVEAGFAFDEVADGGVFYDHARPEGVPREAEEIGAFIGQDFDDDIGPAGENVGGLLDFVVR